MTNSSKWLAENHDWIDAINEEKQVMVRNSEYNVWYGPFLACGFDVKGEHPYRVFTGGKRIIGFRFWKPAPKKVYRYLDSVSQMKWFVDNGWQANLEGWFWKRNFTTSFAPKMWWYCGTVVSNEVDNEYTYLSDWIVEVDE